MEMQRGGENIYRLYAALDESNHGRYPEIVAMVSSFIRDDSDETRVMQKKRMNEEGLFRFLRHEKRDFRYTIIEKGAITRNSNPLVEAAPSLVAGLLETSERAVSLDILLDGEIMSKHVQRLLTLLYPIRKKHGVNTLGIRAYAKKNRGGYDYPRLLVAADSLAHYLFRTNELLQRFEGRRVPFQ